MAYFPLFIDMEKKHCVVIGGGRVAERKVRQLLEFGGVIMVVAPDVADVFLKWQKAGDICLKQREFCAEDISGAAFVIAATNDKEVNRFASELCRRENIPINVVDDKELCTFYFPALVKRGDVVTAISTGGKSPALAARLKAELDAVIPASCSKAADVMGRYRETVFAQTEDKEQRKQIFMRMLEDVLAEKEITAKEVAEYFEDTGKVKNRHEGQSFSTGAD